MDRRPGEGAHSLAPLANPKTVSGLFARVECHKSWFEISHDGDPASRDPTVCLSIRDLRSWSPHFRRCCPPVRRYSNRQSTADIPLTVPAATAMRGWMSCGGFRPCRQHVNSVDIARLAGSSGKSLDARRQRGHILSCWAGEKAARNSSVCERFWEGLRIVPEESPLRSLRPPVGRRLLPARLDHLTAWDRSARVRDRWLHRADSHPCQVPKERQNSP